MCTDAGMLHTDTMQAPKLLSSTDQPPNRHTIKMIPTISAIYIYKHDYHPWDAQLIHLDR